jgi:hypothetical protein
LKRFKIKFDSANTDGELQWDFNNRNQKVILVPDLISQVMTISVEDVFGQVPSQSNSYFSQMPPPPFLVKYRNMNEPGCSGLQRQHSIKRAMNEAFGSNPS